MKPPIEYMPAFVKNTSETYKALASLNWERRGDAPRCEYYCNDTPAPYVYGRGKGRREYLPKPYVPEILAIRKKLEERVGAKLDVCFLNMYLNQSDHLGWHADDSPEMDPDRPIVTVSVGVAREIWFRPKTDPGNVTRVLLEPGSACVMTPRMQEGWEHRIPKSASKCGERISLTFRGYIPT